MSLAWQQTLIIILKLLVASCPSHATYFSTSYMYNSNQGKPIITHNFQPDNNNPGNVNVQQPLNINVPKVNVPNVNVPKLDVNLPQKPPNINIPNMNVNVPKVDVKLPRKPPKMNVNMPKVDVNVPKLDVNLPHQPMNSASSSDKDSFLQTHNEDRKAVGDPPLVWDDRVAAYAQSWANQRIHDCQMIHSNGPYGENIFWGSGDFSPNYIVQSWASEAKNYDRNSNSCVGGMCLHYTQLMWKDTTRLGCAKVTCTNGGIFAICNYDPRGNYIGSRPF